MAESQYGQPCVTTSQLRGRAADRAEVAGPPCLVNISRSASGLAVRADYLEGWEVA